MTPEDINEVMQLLRTLKISQVRKQLEFDAKKHDFFDNETEEWVSSAQIVSKFFRDAKERL
jgi:hypothetical protein